MAIAGTLEIQLLSNIARLSTDMRKAQTTVGRAMGRVEQSVNMAKRALAGLGLGLGIRELVRYADTWANLEGRLKLVTASHGQFLDVQTKLFEMAQRTRASFESTTDLYTRIARATQQLNTTDEERLRVTEAINKSLIISGASSDSARAAIIQLGQGLASGVLRGEELNSVLEQAPRLARAMAEGLGISIGQLRAFGKEGKLTAENVFGAISGQAEIMNREFERMPRTVQQALTILNNEFLKVFGEGSAATGAGLALAEMIEAVAKSVRFLKIPIQTIAVLAANVEFVLSGIGREIGGIAAQLAALARGDFGGFSAIREALIEDGKKARAELDAWEKRVMELGTRGPAAAAAGGGMVGGVGTETEDKAREKMLDAQAQAHADRLVERIERTREVYAEELFLEESLTLAKETERDKAIEALQERLARERELRREAVDDEIALARERVAAEQQAEQDIRDMKIGTWQLGAALLQEFAGKSKTAAIAVIAINKALAIAQTIQATAVAVMRAFSDLGPIAGAPVAASMKTLGAVQVGLIAATGLFQAANVGSGGASPGTPANPISTTPGIGAGSAATQAPRGQTTIVNLYGQTYSRKQVRELLEAQNENSVDGSRTVVVER